MKMPKKLKIKLTFLLMMLATALNAQTNGYKFMRKITGVDSIWHSIKLPDQLYKNINAEFEDLRIFGIKEKDTVEVPYLLKERNDKISLHDVPFKKINQSNNNDVYFYTFQLENDNTINQINLSFKQTNFDWKVKLEGSNDNQDWFSILKDSRILSIKNKDTDYQYTKLNFPDSKYKYFRIALKNSIQPDLFEAKIVKIDTVKGNYHLVKYQTFDLKNDAKTKETIIEVNLKNPVPISYLKLHAESDFDFYRSIRIEYATDSFKTDQGMQYNYAHLYNGTISSFEPTVFKFKNTLTSHLKITIQNHDNKPLRISNLTVQGNYYELIARFDGKDYNYFLYYGNDKVLAPSYEIEKFESKIPIYLTGLDIGEEQKNPSYFIKIDKPLFENKIWLWALMAIIIALLGWFSFKMLKN